MIKKDLFDTNASLYVLSCLMHKPLLLQDERYAFVKTDFYKPLQQMVFYAIFNMAQNGVERITPQDIDLYIKQFDTQYEFYKKEKGYEFVVQCYQTAEGSDEHQFDSYYNRLKRCSNLCQTCFGPGNHNCLDCLKLKYLQVTLLKLFLPGEFQ